MERPISAAKEDLKKGPWTREEDQKLLAYIEQHGQGSWRSLPAKAGLQRCGKSCRLRWTNYLRPDIKRGKFSTQEEKTIIRFHALLGNRWSAIAAHLPKRTDNEIKNYWNTRLKKRLTRMGIDPVTHKPKNIAGGHSKQAAKLSHMAQWEAARLEAEARLVRESKFLSSLQVLQRSPALSQPCLDVLKAWKATGASKCFFGSLESPTSTLAVVPGVDDKVIIDNMAHANGENLNNLTTYPLFYGGYNASDAANLAVDGYSVSASGSDTAELEDTRNYWNELLNMVTNYSMELPGF